MQYNLFDSFDNRWSLEFKENMTDEQKEILRNGLKESELQDVGDRMNEDVEQIVSKTIVNTEGEEKCENK